MIIRHDVDGEETCFTVGGEAGVENHSVPMMFGSAIWNDLSHIKMVVSSQVIGQGL